MAFRQRCDAMLGLLFCATYLFQSPLSTAAIDAPSHLRSSFPELTLTQQSQPLSPESVRRQSPPSIELSRQTAGEISLTSGRPDAPLEFWHLQLESSPIQQFPRISATVLKDTVPQSSLSSHRPRIPSLLFEKSARSSLSDLPDSSLSLSRSPSQLQPPIFIQVSLFSPSSSL